MFPHPMRRKAICLAGKTLVLSLPRSWVKKQVVKKGDELVVIEKGSKLVVQTEDLLKVGAKKVNVSNTLPLTARILSVLFKMGYNQLIVQFADTKELQAIQQVVREEFIGFEVIKREKQQLHIDCVSASDVEKFSPMLRRVWFTLINMAEDIIKAVKTKDTLWLNNIALMDKDVNKQLNFCRRLLNQHNYALSDYPLQLYHLLEQLERIGDSYKELALLAADKKCAGKAAYTSAHDLLRFLHDCAYHFSFDRLLNFHKQYATAFKHIQQKLSTSTPEQVPAYATFLILFNNLFAMNGALLTLHL